MQHLLVPVGKAHPFQRNGAVCRQLRGRSRALQLLLLQNVRRLAHDGAHLGQIVGIGKGGQQGLHHAEGKHDDRQKVLHRQAPVHIQQAAHRQHPQQRGGEDRHARRLAEQIAAHPVDKAVGPLLCGGDELGVAGLGLAEGFDDLDAADVFHGGVVQRLGGSNGALKVFLIVVEHGHQRRAAQRHHDQHGKAHPPVYQKQQRQHRQRAHDIGGHLRQQVRQRGLDGVYPLHDDIL